MPSKNIGLVRLGLGLHHVISPPRSTSTGARKHRGEVEECGDGIARTGTMVWTGWEECRGVRDWDRRWQRFWQGESDATVDGPSFHDMLSSELSSPPGMEFILRPSCLLVLTHIPHRHPLPALFSLPSITSPPS